MFIYLRFYTILTQTVPHKSMCWCNWLGDFFLHIPLSIQVDVSVLDGKEICLNGSDQRVSSEKKVCIAKICIYVRT